MLSKIQKTVARIAFRKAFRLERSQQLLWLQTLPTPEEAAVAPENDSTDNVIITTTYGDDPSRKETIYLNYDKKQGKIVGTDNPKPQIPI